MNAASKGNRTMKQFGNTILLGGLCVAFLFSVGCQEDEITSHWKDREITIDGDQTDWQGLLSVSEAKNIAFGIMNDESNLCVTLSTSNRNTMMQVMRLGFTVWFDPNGGTKEVFGVKYPVGIQGMGPRSEGRSGRSQDSMPDMEEQIRSISESQLWVEVLGPGKDDVARISAVDTAGIQVRLGYSNFGQLVYEMRIPLKSLPQRPQALDVSPGGIIGVGFKTGVVDWAARRSQRPGGGMRGGRPGGMAGGRSGGRPGGGMRGGSPRGAMLEPFTYWAKVTLATNELRE